ncbi:hypothetical protein ACPXCS_12715 [Streptomyces sp. DT190]|uniref:hypothetical protein n=1 Tax=unclassified Streptomyces TaxID=2593676 RepID=UPI003CF99770
MSSQTKYSAPALLLIISAAALVVFSHNAIDQPIVGWTALSTGCALIIRLISLRRSARRRR